MSSLHTFLSAVCTVPTAPKERRFAGAFVFRSHFVIKGADSRMGWHVVILEGRIKESELSIPRW